MTPTVQYFAVSNGVWKDCPGEFPLELNFKDVYRAVEELVELRPQFLFRVVWPSSLNGPTTPARRSWFTYPFN
jgi:hypothetical protein